MSFFHGVTVTNVDIGARTIALPASSVIGLCDVFTPGAQASAKPNVPVLLTSKKDAAAAFGIGSSIYLACEAIYNRAQAVIVAVGVEAAETPEAQASAVIGGISAAGERTGLQALLDGKSRFNAQPRLLVAPGHSAQQAVATAMDGLAEKLRAIAILDGPNSTDEAAVAYAKNFGSKRLFMVDPGVQVWDSATNAARNAPASAYAAGLFAWTDAEYGFWSSPSNKEIKGVTGTSRPVEFLDGDETCRANLLNNANIATIIRDDGYRLWGNRTLSSDSKWAFVTRVRTMDLVMDAILAGHKWAVDRGITKTYVKDVTEGLRAFMRDLKNQGAVINFEVYADPDLNSASQLAQGKVYWNIRFTDVPPAENPNFRVEVTDQWLTEVLDVAYGAPVMIPQTLTNTNLFIDGVSFAGDVPSLTLPKLAVKTEQYRAGGMDAPVSIDMGLEAMEAKFSTNGARREALNFFGLADQSAFNGVFRGSFKGQKGASVPLVATLRGLLKEVDPGDWKAGEKAEFKYAVAVSYYKLEVDGREVYEIDPVNGVRAINGVDQLAGMRNDLGL